MNQHASFTERKFDKRSAVWNNIKWIPDFLVGIVPRLPA